ncbi:hypothetical protein LOTGIDRAFT_162013 [Lottia gigantea]|uniref:SGNH hydrolase-type esterase domain-containing protein n=1 Tax=Lottia gigantea TaxID=225164 RepID=V4BVE4_LOTGI|nr:hypothetical protein LOTGIDRAFT_162013 [Lottia gigantea]ESO92989.1 hypothetical protein LOTGIDRAFT_162013 [Lottia gigantea]
MSLKGNSSNNIREKKDNGRFLKEGRKVEGQAEVAFIGDSNFRGLLEYELKEWQLDRGMIVRCYSGGRANDMLKKCCLPDESRVKTVVIGIGGNDLNGCNDVLNELDENNKKSKADKVIQIVADKITDVAKLYKGIAKRVYVMLPGLRKKMKNSYVLKLNRFCKEKLDDMNIEYLDTAEELLKEKQLIDCVIDGVHYRDSFLKKMIGKICKSLDLPFQLPEIKPTNWPATMPEQCFACGEKTTNHE